MGFLHAANRGLNTVLEFVLSLTVEPIAFLNFLSFNLFMIAHHAGLYEVICYQTFPDSLHYTPDVVGTHQSAETNGHGGHSGHGGGGGGHGHRQSEATNYHSNNGTHNRSHSSMNQVVDCKHLGQNLDAENTVQERMSEFSMYYSLAHMIPTILAHIFMGALGDKYGRKINILVGIVGVITNTLPFLIVMEIKLMPLWILIVVTLFTSLTGGMGIIMMSSFAYLADINVIRENLTVRMTVYAVITSASGVIGSLLAAACIKHLKISYICVLQIAFLTVSFFYAFIRLKQVPPVIMKKRMIEKEIKKSNGKFDITKLELAEKMPHRKEKLIKLFNDEKPKVKLTTWQRIKNLAIETWHLLVSVWRTYTKSRPDRRRLYLLLVAGIFFLDLLSNMAMHINSIYVFRSPFSWDGEKLAYWKAVGNVLHFVANLIGVIIFKKLLKLRETTIMLIALSSHLVQEIIMGLATSSWMLYLSTCIGCMSPLFMPTVKSFVTQMVDTDEVGKSFIMFGLAHDIGMAISTIGSNAIYRATVRFFPGFIYLFCSGFLASAIVILIFVHVDSIRRENQSQIVKQVDKH